MKKKTCPPIGSEGIQEEKNKRAQPEKKSRILMLRDFILKSLV